MLRGLKGAVNHLEISQNMNLEWKPMRQSQNLKNQTISIEFCYGEDILCCNFISEGRKIIGIVFQAKLSNDIKLLVELHLSFSTRAIFMQNSHKTNKSITERFQKKNK